MLIMLDIVNDVRYVLRTFAKSPAFALTVILTVAIGIGPTTAIFSIVDSLLLRELPYRDAESLVAIWRARDRGDKAPTSGPDFADFRTMSTSFSDMAVASWTGSFNVGEIATPLRVAGARVTPNFFELLGTPAALGAAPSPAPVKGEKLVVLSDRLWRNSFGGARDIVGRDVRLSGQPYRVLAVMPPAFAYPPSAELWVPFDLTAENLGHRALHQYHVVARLKPGVMLAQANDELKRIAHRLGETYPDTTRGIDAWAMTMRDSLAGELRKPLLVLFAAVALLLLIACSNVANLLLTASAARERELAIRSAIGATEWRLARQLLTETLLLTAAGATLGLGFAALAVRVARALGSSYFARPELITIDGRVLLFNFAVAIGTGLVFGLAPVLRRRTHMAAMKKQPRMREAIVVAVIALSFFLLAGAGLLIHSFTRLRSVAIGVRPERLLTVQMYLPPARYPDVEVRTRIVQRVIEALRDTPGITAAASVSGLPLENTMSGDIAFPNEGHFTDERRIASFTEVSPGYFAAAGVPLLEGRDFSDDDVRNLTSNPLPPILINRTMAGKYWPGRSPIGQRVLVGGEAAMAIVGVVGDVRQGIPSEPVPPHVYMPLGTPLPPRAATFLVRSTLSHNDVLAVMRRILSGIDADVPPYNARTMDEIIAASTAGPRFQTVLLVVFATVSLALAAIGIYGVISYNVAQRTREIGIRMALGASSRTVLELVIGKVARLAVLGVAIGIAGGILLGRAMESLLFEVEPGDPRVFAAAAALLLLTAIAAGARPARRAASVDPARSLNVT